MKAKVIKSVSAGHFELTLLELDSGSYCVMTVKDEVETFSEPIRDRTNAMHVFESKFIELQGH